jgi:hypothetical protein
VRFVIFSFFDELRLMFAGSSNSPLPWWGQRRRVGPLSPPFGRRGPLHRAHGGHGHGVGVGDQKHAARLAARETSRGRAAFARDRSRTVFPATRLHCGAGTGGYHGKTHSRRRAKQEGQRQNNVETCLHASDEPDPSVGM